MKRCYRCGTSFAHEGDPIDGNEFCRHECSAAYIEWVRGVSRICPRFQKQVFIDRFQKQVKKCEEHFKNLPLGMKSDVYRLKPDPRVPEIKENIMEVSLRVGRLIGELYHKDPEVKWQVDECQKRCKAYIKELEEKKAKEESDG